MTWLLLAASLAAPATLAAATAPDTVFRSERSRYLVSRREIAVLVGDSVRARLPWSASPGLAPVSACPGPDGGLLVLDASRGGRIVHLGRWLRVVSIHPLPEEIRPSDLAGAVATWEPGRGLVVATARPPRRWLLGFLASPARELAPLPEPVTDSVPPIP